MHSESDVQLTQSQIVDLFPGTECDFAFLPVDVLHTTRGGFVPRQFCVSEKYVKLQNKHITSTLCAERGEKTKT